VRRTLLPRLAGERGSVLITGLFLTIALLMVIGAAVDLGHAFVVKRELASIADDAALTGSQALDQNALHQGAFQLDSSQARTAALNAITRLPGESTRASATTSTITVHVSRRFPTLLLRLVGLDTLTVSAQASAAPRRP
jgi:Flp pilus assembly protein TadG